MIPVLTKEQAYNLDKDSIENGHLSQEELMDNAGKAVAQFFCEKIDNPFNQKVVVVCGKGNNGGDGVIAHSYLKRYNVSSQILFTEEKHGHSKLLKKYIISKSEYSIYNNKTNLDKYDWIIDGIFGIGLSRPLEAPCFDIIYQINENKNIISIDIPSGVYANGRGNTHSYIKPSFTLALGYVKIGFFDFIDININDIRKDINKPIALDIGFKKDIVSKINLIQESDVRVILKKKHIKKNEHKYNKMVDILAGSEQYPGAAILSCNAAFKSGSGYVRLLSTFSPLVKSIIDSKCIETVVTKDFNTSGFDSDGNLLFGPGLDPLEENEISLSKYFIEHWGNVVYDASALHSNTLKIMRNENFQSNDIFTPHLGEYKKMFHIEEYDESLSLVEFLEIAQKKLVDGQIVILKGVVTFIIEDDLIYIMNKGSTLLATAGTGDVLSGILVSLLSQGYSRLEASILGTYLHAEAANYYMNNISKDGMTASDLIDCIPHAFNILRANE